ncbi:MAG: hypothetical protein GTO02_03000 [Candidatus Dadabacteria bacterium]|nr:hypothetical protein [Candidatus Dadabacteria bacterium]
MINATALGMFIILDALVGPLKVNSAYRSPEHNARVGGTPHSKHVYGKAFDIATHHLNKEQKRQLEDKARKFFDYVKVYPTHIHVHIN